MFCLDLNWIYERSTPALRAVLKDWSHNKEKVMCFHNSAGCQPERDESFRNSGKHYHFLFFRMNRSNVTFIASQIRFDIQRRLKRDISFERETLKHLK
jgi:hypothetical protein